MLNEEEQSKTSCEVCGNTPPSGHRICDDCWPDRAVAVGRAAVCAECGRPRLVEKLVAREDGTLICAEHQPAQS